VTAATVPLWSLPSVPFVPFSSRCPPVAQIELYSPTYFAACGFGGIISCGVTHGLMTPLDLVKCNAQTNPKEFPGAIAGIRAIYSGKVTHLGFGSGLSGLAKGWAPTFIGYGLQGLCKFGFYEYFKVGQRTQRGAVRGSSGSQRPLFHRHARLSTPLYHAHRTRMRACLFASRLTAPVRRPVLPGGRRQVQGSHLDLRFRIG